jgi:hypothetical protein
MNTTQLLVKKMNPANFFHKVSDRVLGLKEHYDGLELISGHAE